MATSPFSYSGQNLAGYTHIQPDRKSYWLSSGSLTLSSLVRLYFSPGFPKLFPNWSPSPLSICTSSSSRQSLKACFVLNRFGFSRWKGSWPVFGAVKVRIGHCPLFSPSSSFRWCLQFPGLNLLSRVWRFPNVYHQPQSCSSAQASCVWPRGHESLTLESVPMVPGNLDNPPSLQTGTWSFCLRTVVLNKCYQLSRGQGQKRKEKPDCLRSDSGGRPWCCCSRHWLGFCICWKWPL